MDHIDKHILQLLQNNSQLSNQELAEQVSLSPSPCLRRVKQLESNGIITKHVALINPKKIGLDLTILVLVSLDNHSPNIMSAFEKKMLKQSEVIQCYLITGQAADYQLKVVAPDLESYQLFLLNVLTRIKGVSSVHSSFVLRSITDTTVLPLDHVNQLL